MTRFNITMDKALDLILRALKYKMGGVVVVPKLKAYRVGDMKNAITELLDSKNEVKKIPVRPGEKYHESLISRDEIRNTYETKEDYIIFNEQIQIQNYKNSYEIKKSSLRDSYSSDTAKLFTKDELKTILIKEKLIPSAEKQSKKKYNN